MLNHKIAYLAALAFTLVSAPLFAADRDYFELRVFRNTESEKQAAVLKYLEEALVPALNRAGSKQIGVFVPTSGKPEVPLNDVFVLIPYASLEAFTGLNDTLEADKAYQSAAAEFMAAPKDDPAYTRVESRFMKAFAGMPKLEAPASDSDERLLELRIYESHNAHKARLKVDMFNAGEIDIMKDVKLAPVFFGETLISNDVPNLTYMLSAPSEEAHGQHWKSFVAHPKWKEMKAMKKYEGTVSGIQSIKLKPATCSQI